MAGGAEYSQKNHFVNLFRGSRIDNMDCEKVLVIAMDLSFDGERSLKFELVLWIDNRSVIVVTFADEIRI